MTELLLAQSPFPSSQELVSSQDIRMSQERTYNGKLAIKRSCKAAEWEFIIKGVGQYFYGGRDEARLVVEKYNHFFGRRMRVVKSNPERYTVEFYYKEKLECDWMFHAAPKTSNVKGHLFLKAYNGEHKCCAGYSDGTKADPVTRELIKSLIFKQIEQNPNKKARDIVRELKTDYGLEVSYDQAHAGKELCFKELYGEDIKSYTDLRWWCEAVEKHDPGSRDDLVVEGGEFKSLFLAFDACISGFEYCRPVLFLDATFLTGKFRGCLMAATGKNANNGIFPLAYGIVSAETVENWHWFLKKLESILGPRVLTFISDRHEGLIQGIRDVFPTFYHAWCYQHLKNNVRSKTNKKKGEHCAAMGLFKECFYSSTHEGFDQGMQKLKDMGSDGLHKFLSEIPVECWSNAHCLGCRYGDMCSNIQSPLTLGSRKQKVCLLQHFNWIRLKIMEQMSTRKRKGATYKRFICPTLEKKVLASIRAGVQWRITKSGDMEWEVFDGKHTHAVNIAKFQCSSRVWFTEQFPCDHAIACMHSNNINVYEYINPYFSIASFRASYDRPIKPIPDYDKPIDVATGDLVNPPTVVGKKHGRPKKKRIPNTGSASFKRPITCGNFHTQAHHNKTTCPHPPAKKQR
ncbi:uncharacterized protein LOC113272337 [Papaver somniferum]|uniref:uncharacterized protein LOC113272337 n=1 Tax=Papaver somniferum TaxID=3469 RepID=UPI000E6FBA29|nr:uncharacterized protein LOC113272337 [Papaver somniferum]